MILAEITCILFEINSVTMAQNDAEPGFAANPQQKPGIKLHKANRWDKTRRGLL